MFPFWKSKKKGLEDKATLSLEKPPFETPIHHKETTRYLYTVYSDVIVEVSGLKVQELHNVISFLRDNIHRHNDPFFVMIRTCIKMETDGGFWLKPEERTKLMKQTIKLMQENEMFLLIQ